VLKPSLSIKEEEGETRVIVGPVINEDMRALMAANEMRLGKKIVFDFSEVQMINSVGVRDWCLFMARLNSAEVSYENCSEAVILEINMVCSFKGKAIIKSINREYECLDCRTKAIVHLNAGTDFDRGKLPEPQAVSCERCGKGSTPVTADDELFLFLTATDQDS